MKNKYKAIFFDFDGVIVDSVSIKTEAFSILFEKYGEAVVNQVASYHIANGGINRADKFKHYYSEILKLNIDDKELDVLCNNFSNIVVDKIVGAEEIVGVKNFLENIYQYINCFVISATPEKELVKIITKRKIIKYFIEIRGGPMSKAQHIKELLKKYNYSKSQVCFIGDAVEDYIAAKNSNIDFFGIISGPESPLYKLKSVIKWSINFNSDTFKIS